MFDTARPKNLKTETDSNKNKCRNKKVQLPSLSESPDPCHYNPNYNAIYKKVPAVRMVKPSVSPRRAEQPKKIKQRKILESNEESKDEPKRKKISLLPPVDYFGKNHALRFSQYPNRKTMIQPFSVDKLSYVEPFDYLTNVNKAVDFKKMKERCDSDLINVSALANPSIGYYEPKYDIIVKKSPRINFSPRKNLKLSKQFLIKKIWNSYEVPVGYQLVKFNTEA